MEYMNLGQTDINVSRLCVGCMSFGDPASNFHAWTLNTDESESLIKHALDLGINFFDTANVYSAGTSEEYLGRAIRKHVARDQVVLATKAKYFDDAAGAFQVGLSTEEIAYLEEPYVPHKIVGAL